MTSHSDPNYHIRTMQCGVSRGEDSVSIHNGMERKLGNCLESALFSLLRLTVCAHAIVFSMMLNHNKCLHMCTMKCRHLLNANELFETTTLFMLYGLNSFT